MGKTIDQLRSTLAELHAELDQLETLDEESRTLLEAAKRDLDDALSREKVEEEQASLAERFERFGEDFQESHPDLAHIVGSLANTLSQMGI